MVGEGDLHDRDADDYGAGAHDLLQVDFQPDHEQHQDQAELGDHMDRFLRLHEVQTGRAEQETADEIGQNGRLAEKLGADTENPGGDDGKSDVLDQSVHTPVPEAPVFGHSLRLAGDEQGRTPRLKIAIFREFRGLWPPAFGCVAAFSPL